MDKALAANDGTEAGIESVQADYWKTEVARAQERLQKTLLRSPIDGVWPRRISRIGSGGI